MKLLTKSKYNHLVATSRKRLPPKTNPLRPYWDLGDALLKYWKPAYGTVLIRKMAADIGMHHAVLYTCMKFRKLWPTREDDKRLIEKGVLWTHIRVLTHSKLSATDRRKLVDHIEKKQPTVQELKERVRKLVAKKKARPDSVYARRKKR